MNRKFASALSVLASAAAILAAAAIATGNAYADDITMETTPFVSTRTRADVRTEVIGQSRLLSVAASEWSMQMNKVTQPGGASTRAQATAEYIAARDQVRAQNGEDSGSTYFASMPHGMASRVVMARQTR